MDSSSSYQALVAAKVSETIDTHGVTVVWLCEKTGIARTTLARRLGGHSPFTVAELAVIATALRVPISTLAPELEHHAVPA